MKKLFLVFLLPALAFYGCSNDDNDTKQEVTTSFEGKLTTADSQYIAYTQLPAADDYTSYLVKFQDKNKLVEMNHYYASWGFAGGATYTNKTDTSTPGVQSIGAITGKGKTGNTYLTVYANSYTPIRMTNLNPDKYHFKGCWVTNCTYTYLAIKEGNAGTGIDAYKFTTNDWYKITVLAYNAQDVKIGEFDYYLADFRNSKSEIVNEWQWLDLGIFAQASYIEFEMSSTDNHPVFGMLTPGYFCMDAITLVEK